MQTRTATLNPRSLLVSITVSSIITTTSSLETYTHVSQCCFLLSFQACLIPDPDSAKLLRQALLTPSNYKQPPRTLKHDGFMLRQLISAH